MGRAWTLEVTGIRVWRIGALHCIQVFFYIAGDFGESFDDCAAPI
jgi:hypothetical protein